jgi:thiaminase (transcriptional activator TenA)
VSLSERLWATMAPTYAAILRHPFLAGLTDGTLEPDCFAFYLTQDARYLVDYARALAVLAARADDPRHVAMFARHAAGALEVERELHTALLPELGLDPAVVAAAESAPTNLGYTSYLLATAYGGEFANGVAAVLPCYWIYAKVGAALVDSGSPDPRYARWIDTYAGEEFALVVAEVLALVDELGDGISAAREAQMHRHAAAATRYEWLFWDMAWRREEWPIA